MRLLLFCFLLSSLTMACKSMNTSSDVQDLLTYQDEKALHLYWIATYESNEFVCRASCNSEFNIRKAPGQTLAEWQKQVRQNCKGDIKGVNVAFFKAGPLAWLKHNAIDRSDIVRLKMNDDLMILDSVFTDMVQTSAGQPVNPGDQKPFAIEDPQNDSSGDQKPFAIEDPKKDFHSDIVCRDPRNRKHKLSNQAIVNKKATVNKAKAENEDSVVIIEGSLFDPETETEKLIKTDKVKKDVRDSAIELTETYKIYQIMDKSTGRLLRAEKRFAGSNARLVSPTIYVCTVCKKTDEGNHGKYFGYGLSVDQAVENACAKAGCSEGYKAPCYPPEKGFNLNPYQCKTIEEYVKEGEYR